jgi:hypothetical protein
MIYISNCLTLSGIEQRKISSTKSYDYYLTSDGRCFRLPAYLDSKDVCISLRNAIKGMSSKAKLMNLSIIRDKPYVWIGHSRKCLASAIVYTFTSLGEVSPSHILFIDGDITNCSVSNLAITDGKAINKGAITTIKKRGGQSIIFRSCASAATSFGYSKSYLSKMVNEPMQSRSDLIDYVTMDKRNA